MSINGCTGPAGKNRCRAKRLISVFVLAALLITLLPGIPGAAAVRKEDRVLGAENLPYKGIDVSKWQGTMNWAKARQNGVDFAILRCYASGKDTYFDANYSGAVSNGIAVGAYVYMYATSESAAYAEANNAVAALGGRSLTFPLFLDVEDSTVKALGKDTITRLMLIELQVFTNAGYRASIYTSQSYTTTYMDMSRLSAYDLWIARWTCYYKDSEPDKRYYFSDQDPYSGSKPGCNIWQFSNAGDGACYGASSARIDLDYCYTDYINPDPAPEVDNRYPTFKVYTNSTSKVQCYDYVDGPALTSNFIYVDDECIVQEVYTNGWCKFLCPWPGYDNMETKYAPLTVFLPGGRDMFILSATHAEKTAYRKSDLAEPTKQTVIPACYLWKVGQSGNSSQILYSTPNGTYCGWLNGTIDPSESLWVKAEPVNSACGTVMTWDTSAPVKTVSIFIFKDNLNTGTNYSVYDITERSVRVSLPAGSYAAYLRTVDSGDNDFYCFTDEDPIYFIVPSGDHSWNSGTVTVQPSCTEAGERSDTCTCCGSTKTETVPALGHDFVNGVCTRCGAADPNGLLGDVDCNGIVNIRDVMLLSRYVAEMTELSEAGKNAADVDHNGIVNIRDVMKLARCVAELDQLNENGKPGS